MSRFKANVFWVIALLPLCACHKNVQPVGQSEHAPASGLSGLQRATAKPGAQQAGAGKLPAGHPPLPTAGGAATGAQPAGGKAVSFKAPEGWVSEKPATSMRKAQYRWPAAKGSKADSAELAVYYFPGAGGGVQQNLQRWFGQFEQTDGRPPGTAADVQKRTVNGLAVTVAYLSGTYLKPEQAMNLAGPVKRLKDHALLAAIAETAQGPWFFKAVGPKATVDAHRKAFDGFVATFRPSASY